MCPSFTLSFFKTLFIFGERGREGEREGEKHQCVVVKGPPTVAGVDRVLEDEDPEIRVLASITYKLLKDVAHKLTSSVIKQTSRRLVNFIYIKKLKPLYNYNSPNDVTEKPYGDERNQEWEERPYA